MLEFKTKISILEKSFSLFTFLSELKISKSQIKKFNISKSLLEKKLKNQEEIELPLSLVNHDIINPIYEGPKVTILYEDSFFLCLDKPSNVHCIPLGYSDKNNLLSFLRQNLFLKNTDFFGERKYEGGLLYRLDFETTGVLFFSKKKEIYQRIRKNFRDFATEKEYICIVQGKFSTPGMYISKFSGFGPKNKRVRIDKVGNLGEGILTIEVISYQSTKDLTLLKIKLETGVRHQIRVQLAHLGYPILGDTFYGGPVSIRLFLHAFKYQINMDNQVWKVYSKQPVLFDRFFDLHGIF